MIYRFVCVCMCMCLWCMYVCTNVERTEAPEGFLVSTVYSLNGIFYWTWLEVSKLRCLSYLCSHNTEVADMYHHSVDYFIGTRCLNSGPYVCVWSSISRLSYFLSPRKMSYKKYLLHKKKGCIFGWAGKNYRKEKS